MSNGGLIVAVGVTSQIYHELIITLAARHRLPVIYPYRFFVTGGGLISYGPELLSQYRRAASYVDRILRGETPGDLPVQAPTGCEMVLNLKTAKTLGLDIPASVLARSDEVIEMKRRSSSRCLAAQRQRGRFRARAQQAMPVIGFLGMDNRLRRSPSHGDLFSAVA